MGGVFDIVRTGDITYRAKLVSEKVEMLYKKYDLGPLTVIGHSEGGIIGRYYVQFHGGDKFVRSLITLGSPHQGTSMAIAGAAVMGFVARNLFQLMPGSSVLKKLAGKPFPQGVEFHSIYSTDDWICPPSACRAVDAQGTEIGTNVEMNGFGHNDFLIKKEPYKMIRKLLFKIPEGASCMEDQGARAAAAG
jgi:triacylglycerol esterase/lipase EstA (alpha/beta hydrolase family)